MKKLLLAFLATTTAACGGDGVSFDEFETKYFDALCANQVECQYQPSAATCKATTALNDSSFETLADAVARGTVKYDEEAGGNCIAAVRDQGCQFEGFVATDSPCDDMFTGTVAQGGACAISVECVGDAPCNQTDPNCDSDVACCPGTCGAPRTVLASGASCGENDVCATGLYCKFPATTGNGTCSALIASEGAACDDLVACAAPMICNVFAAAPTCQRPAASGATCDPDALFPCIDFREHCDGASLKCVPALPNGSACETGSVCLNSSDCAGGTCQSQLGLNAACSDTTPDCLGSLDCTNGTCQAEPAGMSCI